MSYHSINIFELVVSFAVSVSNIVMSLFVNNSNSCSELFELSEIFDSISSMYVTFAKRDLFFCLTNREKFEFFSFSSFV